MILRAAKNLYWRLRMRARRSPLLFRLYASWVQFRVDARHSAPYRIAFASRRLSRPFHGQTMLCYPERPIVESVIFKICMLNGWSITTKPRPDPDYVIAWEDSTCRTPDPTLERLAEAGNVINMNLTDISKVTVERAFREAFSYGTLVDPTVHDGKCVCKSDVNAMHDGRVITCPIAPDEIEPGKVYQRLLDNTLDDGMVRDIRVPVFGTMIPFAYFKDRPIETRFSNTNARAAIVPVDNVLSTEERDRLLVFCRALGMDYGELDAIRDRATGRLYVVDANSTPSGPPNHLPPEETRKAARMLARSFVETMPRYIRSR